VFVAWRTEKEFAPWWGETLPKPFSQVLARVKKQTGKGEKYMSANDYAEQVVDNFITDITDHIFISIEHNDSLMRDYMTNVNRYGLSEVNMAIGKKVGNMLNLDDGDRNEKPQSRLIDSYTRHKRK
jgi:hypothetical protein